jgi:L-rhamnose-H+ transport protein
MFIGLLLAILSGICYGICFLPIRYMNKFAWENIWFVYSLFGVLVLPVLTGWLTMPFLFDLYRQVGWRTNSIILALGFLSGASAVLYGLALIRIGMALVNAIGNGISIVLGSFIPLLIQHREALQGRLGFALIFGIVLGLMGVVICAAAASKREQESAYMDPSKQKGKDLRRAAMVGVILTVVWGVLGSNMNFGLAFAGDYVKIAKARGTGDAYSAMALFIPITSPGFATSCLYFAYLWRKNRTIRQFRESHAVRFSLICLLMAVVWFAGMLLYGWAMPWMKSYGPVLGWPIMMSSISIVSAIVEWCYGDWKGRALRILSYGLVALTGSIATLGYANWLIQKIA